MKQNIKEEVKMTKVSKNNVEETVVEAVEEVKETATEAVAEKEAEIKVEDVKVKKSAKDKIAGKIAKYRKPFIRFLEVVVIGGVAYAIYNATKQPDDEDVIEGDFTRLDNEE
jgi:hypothetical protein